MSSSKREFINFAEWEGKVNEDTLNYEFPKLFKTAATGKLREWAIYIRLIKEDSKKPNETNDQNWNLLAENQIKIKPEYIDDDAKLPDGIAVELWTESGAVGMKISRSAATYILGKNIGKKNERNALQQAMVDARSKYLKKIEEGSVTHQNSDDDDSKDDCVNQAVNKLEIKSKLDNDIMFLPMLAKNYKDLIDKVVYPVYIQPKLDGNRCVSFLNKQGKKDSDLTYENVILYTRTKKEYPYNANNNNIRKELLPILINNFNSVSKESLYLDGELYAHNVSLQQINSDVRGSNNNSDSDSKSIQYHIYDMFYPSYVVEPFEFRTNKLKNIFGDKTYTLLKRVPTKLIHTIDECDKLYVRFLEEKYEGAMIRTPMGAYMKSTIKSSTLRSKNLLKRKEIYTDEFEVVDFKQGVKGKEVGLVIWICAVSTDSDLTFSVVPNMTHKKRELIYKECNAGGVGVGFIKKYKNRMLTVEYRGYSDNGTPLQIKAIGFRDF
jgi:ATP-dependent DNA ligase